MTSFGFQWHLTDRCNRRCAHCYQDDFTPRSERPLADLRAMADAVFTAPGIERVSVNLTGGEPLLLPALPDLVEHLSGFETLAELNVITNGTITDEVVLAPLADLPQIGCLKVSLESAVSRVNEAVRGDGNLAEVRRNIPLLCDRAGAPVVLMVTLGAHNVATIEETVRLARETGAAGLILERFVPLGRGRRMASRVLDARTWRDVLDTVGRIADVDPAGLIPFTAFWLHLDETGGVDLSGARCNLGGDSMALMPDGTVLPCRRLPLPVGRLPEEPFDVIRARLAREQPGGHLGCRALGLATES